MEEVAFALTVDDGWPPVGVEYVWCDRIDGIYQLRNAPFFIKGLALGDKFSAVPDTVNASIFEFTVVEASGHSLVWILELDGLDLQPYVDELIRLGLTIEAFPEFKHHAIDVPAAVDRHAINTRWICCKNSVSRWPFLSGVIKRLIETATKGRFGPARREGYL